MEDRELLQAYSETRSEAAFSELVSRHVNLVYSAARRLVGDAHLAQDVAQLVFIDLARKPQSVRQPDALAGWLYLATHYAAAQIVRTERRRQQRETEAMNRAELEKNPPTNEDAIIPLLDDAMRQLKPVELNAVVLRYFEGKSLRDTGAALALSENAAQKRITRALEKMRAHFARRGVTVSSALLATAITANSVQAAPAGFAASVTGVSLAGASKAALTGSLFKTIYMTTKTKIILAAAVIIIATTTAIQQHKINQLQDALAAARKGTPGTAKSASAGKNGSAVPLAERMTAIAKIALEMKRGDYNSNREILDFVDNLKPDEFRDIMDALERDPNTPPGIQIALIEGWAEYDPSAAFAWAKAQNDYSRSSGGLSPKMLYALQIWGSKDMSGALAAINQMDPMSRYTYEPYLLNEWVVTDPQAAFDALLKLPANHLGQNTLEEFFSNWAEADPQSAAAAVLKLTPNPTRNSAILAIATSWGLQNPQAALTWADGLTPGDARTVALNAALAQMVKSDPQAVIAYVGSVPVGTNQTALINALALSWAPDDPAAALAWADNLPAGQTHDQAVQRVMQQIGKIDPATEAADISKLSNPSLVDISYFAGTWAQTDIQGALKWVQSLPASDDSTRQDAYSSVLNTWAQTDPASAAAYLMTIPSDANFASLADKVAGYWANGDPNAALTWAKSLPAGEEQDTAINKIVSTVAKNDPQSAWNYVAQMPPGNGTLQTEANIIVSWSTQDPATAAPLLDDLPSGTIQNDATAKLVTNWSKQDATTAEQWIATLPAGDNRDNAVVALLGVIAPTLASMDPRLSGDAAALMLKSAQLKSDLPTAFAWAASIGNEATRATQLDNVVVQWAAKDVAAATAAIQSANLTDAQRAELMQFVQKPTTTK